MKSSRWLVPLLLAAGCATSAPPTETDPPGPPEWPVLEAGTLQAGAAGGYLALPVGLPLGGYTARSRLFGGFAAPDQRDGDYLTGFNPSGGIQTRVPYEVIWLEDPNGPTAIVKIDLIYSFDGLTRMLERKFSEATGLDLTDRVFTTTSHSHSSYGTFSKATYLYFGTDSHQPEILDRMTDQITGAAVEARSGLAPAAIGVSIDPDFDPIGVDAIFRDRRGENNDLLNAYGEPTGGGYKDPDLTVIRINHTQDTEDTADDEPLALLFHFGVHNTVMDADSFVVSTEVTGHIERRVAELLDGEVVVAHLQGSAGDISPAGRDSDFARLEWLGERAAPRILEVFEATRAIPAPTIVDPAVRTVAQGRDIEVTRGGTVDWWYLPFEEDYEPDLTIFDTDGTTPLTPFDEFRAQHGAALCGDGISLPGFGMEVDVGVYATCLDIGNSIGLFEIAFDMTEDDILLPLPETESAMLGALRIEPVSLQMHGFEPEQVPLTMAFFPGEPLTIFKEQFEKQAAEAGIEHTLLVGYSMDHEGYLLTVEDWLASGYEPGINIWGPLQGEYLIERMVELVQLAGTPEGEDASWPDFVDQEYPPITRDPVLPDDTPTAGTVPSEPIEFLYTIDGVLPADPEPDPTIARLNGIAHFNWIGGDPVVDHPVVRVQHEDETGAWVDIDTPLGPLADDGPAIIMGHTPDPLRGGVDAVDRTHHWYIVWQPVMTWTELSDAPGLPLGRYRFHVEGMAGDGGAAEEAQPYELSSRPFELVPADIDIAAEVGEGLTVRARFTATERGFRLLHMDYRSKEPQPFTGMWRAWLADPAEPTVEVVALGAEAAPDAEAWSSLSLPLDGVEAGTWLLGVEDRFGNLSTQEVTIP